MEMAENEAIKELHKIRPIGGIIPQKRAEAIDMAINALEKQEKIKEVFTHYDFYGCELNVNDYISALSEIKAILKE